MRDGGGDFREKSIYAVHAAWGLSVSDILFQGCQTVIVEGPSDQYYFNALKNYLISRKKISPKQDIVFIPSGGVEEYPELLAYLQAKTKNFHLLFWILIKVV